MKISNRVFWAGTFLTGCTILSAGLWAQQDIQKFAGVVQAPTIRATHFEVIDAAGRVKAQIIVRPDGTVATVGLNAPAGPVGHVMPSQDTLRAALTAQQQDTQLLQLRLEQERLRLEQERIRRDQERLRMNQPSATP